MSRSPLGNLAVDWTRNLATDEEKTKFKAAVLNDTLVLGRLLQIIEDKLRVIQTQEDSPETYEAGYPYKQAHFNGRRAGLNEVKQLLGFLSK